MSALTVTALFHRTGTTLPECRFPVVLIMRPTLRAHLRQPLAPVGQLVCLSLSLCPLARASPLSITVIVNDAQRRFGRGETPNSPRRTEGATLRGTLAKRSPLRGH